MKGKNSEKICSRGEKRDILPCILLSLLHNIMVKLYTINSIRIGPRTKNNYHLGLPIIIIILMVNILYIGSTNSIQSRAFGQSDQPSVIFRSVSFDTNPVPHVPFKLTATILIPNIEPTHVTLSLDAPKGISVLSPSNINLGDIGSRTGEKTLAWTLVALRPDNYPLNITAYSSGNSIRGGSNDNNNYQVTSFPVNVNIGFKIDGTPAFAIRSVRVDPPVTYPGDIGTRLDFNIMNSGYVISTNTSANLKMPPGLSPAWGGADSMYIGNLPPGHRVNASFYVKASDAVTSVNNPLSLLVNHDKGRSILDTQFIVSPKARFEVVNVDQSDQLYPGATNVPIRVTLKNVGSATAQTVTTEFLGGNSIPGVRSNTQTSIGNIENLGSAAPGRVFVSTFVVNIPHATTSGEQSASAAITWSQSDTSGANAFVQTLPITYYIAQGPNYLLYHNGIPFAYIAAAIIVAIIIVVFIVLRKRKYQEMDVYLENSPRFSEKGLSKHPNKNSPV
jgi:hypothetical protein